MKLTLMVALFVASLSWTAFADEPLPAPALHMECSPNKRFCAVSDPATKKTTVVERASGKETLRWSMQGYHALISIADDGDHLVVGYPGMNLIPRNYEPSMPMIWFYRRGTLLRTVPLSELIQNTVNLRRTTSHFYWGDLPNGLNASGHYVVTTVEKRVFTYDPGTAKIVAPSTAQGTTPVKGSGYEGIIFPAAYASEWIATANAKNAWTPSPKDVQELESKLLAFLGSDKGRLSPRADGKPVDPRYVAAVRDFLKRVPNYKRQYVGLIEKGRRVIYVNAFCDAYGVDWHRQPVMVRDGGDCFFNLRYDVKAHAFSQLSVNGSA